MPERLQLYDQVHKERLALELVGFRFDLNNIPLLYELARDVCYALNLRVEGKIDHRWLPQGHTGGLVLAESHYMWHSWPEHDNLSLDIFTCSSKAKLRERAPTIVLGVYQPAFMGTDIDIPNLYRTEHAKIA